MDWYKVVINPKKGQSIVFNNNAIKNIEKERYKLLVTQTKFAKYLGISRSAFQRVITKKNLSLEIASIIVNKILNQYNEKGGLNGQERTLGKSAIPKGLG